MLGPEELNEIARLKRLMPENAEQDYLQELLLFSIFSEVGRKLVFKGGTCLYKLHGLNRFSEDLDFTLCGRADISEAVEAALRRLRFLGVFAQVKDVKKHQREINIRVMSRGPLYHGRREEMCFVPINISLRERVLLEPEHLTISSMYPDIPAFDVFSMRAEEIAAEKVRAILMREKPRDLYDLWFMLRRGIQLNPGLVRRKLRSCGMRFDPGKLRERVDAMGSIWAADLRNLVIGELPEFDEAKAVLLEAFERIG